MNALRRSPALLTGLSTLFWACGPDIKGEGLGDSGTTTADTADSGAPHDTDSGSDTGDTNEPARGDVTVEYTVSWELGDTTVELCDSTLTLEDVDTSYRSWTVWTDAGIELDLDNLPGSAPVVSPVGDGTTVSPGAYRFVVDADSDPDLTAYDSAIASGATPYCLLASGTDLALRAAMVPEPVPERAGAITAVELRLTVIWTDR